MRVTHLLTMVALELRSIRSPDHRNAESVSRTSLFAASRSAGAHVWRLGAGSRRTERHRSSQFPL